MKITKIEKLKDCLGGKYINKFFLSEVTNETFIRSLSKYGKLNYYRDFPRPFYKLMLDKGGSIKGVEGENTLHVMFYHPDDIHRIKQILS